MKKKGISHSGEHAWISKGSLNSLAYVYKLHCGKQLSKEPRDIFVKGTILDVANDFQVSFLIHCTSLCSQVIICHFQSVTICDKLFKSC